MYLIFDTETTGVPRNWNAPLTDSDNWPRAVQLAWQLHDQNGKMVSHEDYLINPEEGFNIPFEAEKIHGISTELASDQGISLSEVIEKFEQALKESKFIVGHNLRFDINILGAEFYRLGKPHILDSYPVLDTCTESTAILCQLLGGKGGRYKLPTLSELYKHLFDLPFNEAHNAVADVQITTRCFFELIRQGQGFKENDFGILNYFQLFQQIHPESIPLEDFPYINLKEASQALRKKSSDDKKQSANTGLNPKLLNTSFSHLHNHTQFSILQSTTRIDDMISTSAKYQMPAVAITDTANMMGVFLFSKKVKEYNLSEKGKTFPIKPIIGCEFYVCEDHTNKTQKDNGYQVVFLAKNKRGYSHLLKLSSISYTEGFYYVPRIDKPLIEKYKNDLIVLTGGSNGEVPSKILNVGNRQAEEALIWWKSLFKEDFYIEISDHGEAFEKQTNEVLLEFSEKYQIKTIATNNTYYINKEDAQAHDILLCIKNNEKKSTPIGRGRGHRFGMTNQENYFKSPDEMKRLFSNTPEAIINISELVDKIEEFDLGKDVILPKFEIPSSFTSSSGQEDKEDDYLRYLTYEGAERLYSDINEAIKERIDFELEVIKNTGYPGYFLIVQDFIAQARRVGVSVGPGRGSAAGSVVAYSLGITSIDPIKYNLLFERFLNPDRISLPDIDVDFDDEGRAKVIDYVIDKYGNEQVAQIITYGTMAARSAIRDVSRALDLPLNDADRLAKLIPNNLSLKDIFFESYDSLEKKLRADQMPVIDELRRIYEADNLEAQTLQIAQKVEGSLRHTGTHACGVIITPDDLTDHIPIAIAKDSDMYVTQFDNNVVEDAGLLKMDFLGLSTLNLIKDSVKLIKRKHNIDIDIDHIPLDDAKTYQLFQRGETVAIFQYESIGMQKHMMELKPTVFDDLIAMNALYRPGPMEYIPSFIRRKHGQEEIIYDLDACQEFLSETYGVTVYQEQVMLLSQKLANFSKGEADVLRKAMGKKQIELLNRLKPKFLEGGNKNGHPTETLEKIWKDWEAFASYAFNKSHATCYAFVGYQTAYLKAHYPEEYMAVVMSHNMGDTSKVSFFLEECGRMNIPVLSPDLNESEHGFVVNKDKAIRVGMGAIKGVGRGAVETIVEGRKKSFYTSPFDLIKRISLRYCNKKSLEGLILAGAFDVFKQVHRAQYFNKDLQGTIFLEKLIKFGVKAQENEAASQLSLFGEKSKNAQLLEPKVPPCQEWPSIKKLEQEKEVLGIYISGHPLDDYKKTIENFCNMRVSELKDLNNLTVKDIRVAGVVTSVNHRLTADNRGWGLFVLRDYGGEHEFKIFKEEYLKFKHFLSVDNFIHLKLRVEQWKDRTTQEKRSRMNFTKIVQLQDVMNANTDKITIKCHIKSINSTWIGRLKELLEKGEKSLNFDVFDPESATIMSFASGHRINISEKLLKQLDKRNLEYKLN